MPQKSDHFPCSFNYWQCLILYCICQIFLFSFFQVVNYSFSPDGYSNPSFLSNSNTELSKNKWTSLPELNEATISNKDDNESSDLSISSLDRKFGHSRFVCVSISDDVKLFPDRESFNLPIEEPSKTHDGETVAKFEENEEEYSLTQF